MALPLEQVDTSLIEELMDLKREREVLATRLARMTTESDKVSPLVFERVRADYQDRLIALDERAAPQKEHARREYAKLRLLLDEVKERREAALQDQEELDFRHRLGEFEESDFTLKSTEVAQRITGLDRDFAAVTAVRERFVAAFDSEEELAQPPADPPPPTAATPAGAAAGAGAQPAGAAKAQPAPGAAGAKAAAAAGAKAASGTTGSAGAMAEPAAAPGAGDTGLAAAAKAAAGPPAGTTDPANAGTADPAAANTPPANAPPANGEPGTAAAPSRSRKAGPPARAEDPAAAIPPAVPAIPAVPAGAPGMAPNDPAPVAAAGVRTATAPGLPPAGSTDDTVHTPPKPAAAGGGPPPIPTAPTGSAAPPPIPPAQGGPPPIPGGTVALTGLGAAPTPEPSGAGPTLGGTIIVSFGRLVPLDAAPDAPEFSIQPFTTIGRTRQNHIQLDAPSVSRRHAQIALTESGYMLRDIGSENGTFVNGERIAEHLLADGDHLQFGAVRFSFHSS